MYEAIIFDCDGVIVDTENMMNKIFKEELSKLGLEFSHEELDHYFSGYAASENLITIEKMLKKPVPSHFSKTVDLRFRKAMEDNLVPIEGIVDVLNKIKHPIAMATNSRTESLKFKLTKIGLLETFHTRFCVEDVENPKPKPDLYLKAANALNIDPSKCIAIEDSVAGITAAVAAGMTVYAYSASVDSKTQLNAGATLTFNTMKELESLLNL
ncbi:HAD family phosphatase [Marinomonas sp. 15G1-11]|uniref:HAD family phosphatase n=1 Tax=Marinomonas phaeophyticola TaxID=3004091 RepID=A0ABT4JV73_9GAMM|nr:HAD family phosphatase [Marinomonas sp. 15G1-11]MCZ2722289.1 HAD family phosphatase [Marinomonas sp. 15G1-11]